MSELRRSLHALVAHPPAQPVAIDVVAARAARITRRRRVSQGAVGLALVATASAAAVGVAVQGRERGTMVLADGSKTAGYVAERPGGYLATGTWRVTIKRGEQVIELSSATSDHCGPTGVVQAGDEVRGSITGGGSTLRVGEEFSCPE